MLPGEIVPAPTDFNYDEYRKRYTLKAEEVPEEDDIVDADNGE